MGSFICVCGNPEPEPAADYDKITPYQGESKLGMRHGKGIYCYEKGDIYDGQWKWGKKHGYGVYTYANGTIRRGFFFEDIYVGEDPKDLFAEPVVVEHNPPRPLTPTPEPAEERKISPEMEEYLRQQAAKRQELREKHKKTREDIMKKYSLGEYRKQPLQTQRYKRPSNGRLYMSV
ncbi:predicted protein [Nematostella vectensis]|uniref:Uncharacterized protein n=1 Tax=Nematostella vectensis TaxID=45351 RepID=A7SLW9_NEMVE|nr:predicted protein [Nematostella vectensis]|eukprot:XP_001627430.1 predicted protein [Nematostella vectensis]